MFRCDDKALKILNRFSLLGALCVAPVGFAQDSFGELLERELEITSQIEAESLASGPRAESLIDLLVDLSQVYEEMGNYELADTTTDRLLEVIRANYGLYSLEQVPGIRQLMARQQERENAIGLWELEQDLLDLADRHPDDVRTVSILSGVADRRLDILRRYEAGEFPPEIVLGCYYEGSFYTPDAALRGSQPMYTTNVDPIRRSCASGSSRRVKRSLLNEAQSMYAAAANIALETDGFPPTEFRDLLAEIIRISYRTGNHDMGRRSYEVLRRYEADAGSAPLVQAERLVQLGDWELHFSRDLGLALVDAALSYYREAYESLSRQDVPQESIDALFSPEIPVVVPSFFSNRLESSEAGSTEYIDVSFNITLDGKTEDIQIVETSANVARADERDLVKFIKRNRFRPRLADGEWLNPAPVSVRYFLRN